MDTRHEAFRCLTSLRTRVSNYWRGLTLPYVEAGVRLIRQNDIEPFVHTLTGFREELTQAEADLNAVYADIQADARSRLGRLYNPSDYPPEVRGLFGLDWDFPSVEPPHYLLRIAPEVYQQKQERIARRFEEAIELAEQAFLGEFARLVSHLTERLSSDGEGERKVFRDSAVTNLVEFFARFRHLDVGAPLSTFGSPMLARPPAEGGRVFVVSNLVTPEAMMTTPTEPPRKATARDLFFFTHPEHWPTWPSLPVVRRHDDSELECGLLYDVLHRSGRTGYNSTVFLANNFLMPQNEAEFLALPKETFDSPEEMAAAGWCVD